MLKCHSALAAAAETADHQGATLIGCHHVPALPGRDPHVIVMLLEAPRESDPTDEMHFRVTTQTTAEALYLEFGHGKRYTDRRLATKDYTERVTRCMLDAHIFGI